MKPSLEEQIAWVQSTLDEHMLDVQRRGELPGAGTAMLAAILKTLKGYSPSDWQEAMAEIANLRRDLEQTLAQRDSCYERLKA